MTVARQDFKDVEPLIGTRGRSVTLRVDFGSHGEAIELSWDKATAREIAARIRAAADQIHDVEPSK